MASGSQAGSSGHPGSSGQRSRGFLNFSTPPKMDFHSQDSQFDISVWYPHFVSCHRYFLDVAQHEYAVQALAMFLNIQLPFQKQPFPVASSAAAFPPSANPHQGPGKLPQPLPLNAADYPQTVSLTPYIRRLIATGHDSEQILHGLFGHNWVQGIGPLHEIERRNYLFACKSTPWLETKSAYDISESETVPFLAPLKNVSLAELEASDAAWGEWLAMQDWMLGPRSPGSPSVKREMEE